MMKKIIVLEPNIANKIAAGEVIECPASVVKELIENSIDAGSTALTVEIRNGGIDYIRVTDNGCGIAQDDVTDAFKRHATSKLSSVEQLSRIETLGFRGEALASISSVAKVSMHTRTNDAQTGTHIIVEGGTTVFCDVFAGAVGTTIEVSELFYNVPARLKFLRSTRSEAAAISDYVLRFILSNPEISIKYINKGRIIYHSFGDGSLENALFCVYGSEIAAQLYPVDFDDGYMKISGYVGSEAIARSNRNQQNIFINRRYIKSQSISHAVQRAYDTRLMAGRFPFFVLNILLSNAEVDVNVHPNKLSVRFKDDARISYAISKSVRDAFARLGGRSMSDAGMENTETNNVTENTELNNASGGDDIASSPKLNGKVKTEDLYRIFHNDARERAHADLDEGRISAPLHAGDSPVERYTAVDSDAQPYVSESIGSIPPFKADIDGRAFDFEPTPPDRTTKLKKPEQIELGKLPYKLIGIAFETFIIIQQEDSIYFIDQHAAHERILYERFMSKTFKFNSQLLLIPQILKLEPLEFSILHENSEWFTELGFVFSEAENMTVTVTAVPDIIGAKNSYRFLNDALTKIRDDCVSEEKDLIRSSIIQSACKHAIKAGERLDKETIDWLIDSYSRGEMPLTCPHGRPIAVRISKFDLQKMFKRIV